MKHKDELKSKISIDGQKFSIKSHTQSDRPARKMRVYLFPAKETVLENFMGRLTRNKVVNIPVRRQMALQMLERHGYVGNKITFSRKAGCQCGCSPGFIVDIKNGMELFVTYNKVKK